MEYDFVFDQRKQQCSMRLAGEQEALARFLLDELPVTSAACRQLLQQLQTLKPYQNWEYQGREFSLLLEQGEIQVQHNSLLFSGEHELPERLHQKLEGNDLHFDQQGLHSECGLEDLLALLADWQQFLQESELRSRR